MVQRTLIFNDLRTFVLRFKAFMKKAAGMHPIVEEATDRGPQAGVISVVRCKGSCPEGLTEYEELM